VLGAVFLALALWGVPLSELRVAFAEMEWVYLIHVTVTWLAQYALRAWRQQTLLRALAPATTFRSNLAIVIVGFFCINAFPARLGEAVRPYLFYEREGVPLGAGFALVLVERVIDLVGIFVVLLAVIAWVEMPEQIVELAGRRIPLVDLGRTTATALLLPLLLALFALAAFGEGALRLAERIAAAIGARVAAPVVHRLLGFGLRFAAAFLDGVAALRSPTRLAMLVLQTVLLFLAMGLMMLALSYAFQLEDRIGFGAGFGVLAISMFGIALPAPPGFAGVFEAAVRGGLAVFGVRGEALAGRALAYALVMHWWPFLLLAGWAAFFLWRDRIGLGRLFRFARGGGGSA
jgi:uncharacterized protein (TIRG00374 family)